VGGADRARPAKRPHADGARVTCSFMYLLHGLKALYMLSEQAERSCCARL
jgi:hypothetical protein